MGDELYFYGNPDSSIYAWMQRHFADFKDWVCFPAQRNTDSLLPFNLINRVSHIERILPEYPKLCEKLTIAEIIQIFETMFFDYADIQSLKPFEVNSSHLQRLFSIEEMPSYSTGFLGLSRLIESTMNLPTLASIICHSEGRQFFNCPPNLAKDYRVGGVYYKTKNIGYWSHNEAEFLKAVLPLIFDHQNPHYQHIEKRFYSHSKIFPDDLLMIGIDTTPKSYLEDLRQFSRLLWQNVLNQLQPGYGVIIYSPSIF